MKTTLVYMRYFAWITFGLLALCMICLSGCGGGSGNSQTSSGSLVGRWEYSGSNGVVGMLIMQQNGNTLTGSFVGSPITIQLTGQNGTGTITPAGYFAGQNGAPSSFTVQLSGAQIVMTLTTGKGTTMTMPFNKISSNPVSPYTGIPAVKSTQITWNASLNEFVVSVTWDRPTMGWDFSIYQGGNEYKAYLYVDTTNTSYDPSTFTRSFPITSAMPLRAGACTLTLEESGYSGGPCDWTDPYGAMAWSTLSAVYSTTLTVP